MRTPWRFVADLVSRKPKKDAADEARSTAGEMKALEYKTAPEDQILDGDPNTQALRAQDDRKVETDLTPLATDVAAEMSSASHEMLDSQTEIGQSAAGAERQGFNAPVEGTALAASARPKKSKVRKKPELTIGSTAAVVTSGIVSPLERVVPRTFIEEMAENDAEVEGLRRQLVKKLTEQNAQLRKMLARFETR